MDNKSVNKCDSKIYFWPTSKKVEKKSGHILKIYIDH